jgi:hypothetical protein
MKNPFKNQTEYPMHPVRSDEYPELITKVHTEFTTAGEKLYQEALKIINSTKLLNEDKVQRLIKLGFTATQEVVEAEKTIIERQLNERTVEIINYYHEQYPLYKFITESQVKEICKKYGLIYGKISQYTGFVPDAKLKIMEKFALKEKDAMHYRHSSWSTSRDSYVDYEHFKAEGGEESGLFYTDREFLIAAPQKDFNIAPHRQVKDYQIVDKPVPDPVVLAPVNGGFLIVCAWGEEASDPIVSNEINN